MEVIKRLSIFHFNDCITPSGESHKSVSNRGVEVIKRQSIFHFIDFISPILLLGNHRDSV